MTFNDGYGNTSDTSTLEHTLTSVFERVILVNSLPKTQFSLSLQLLQTDGSVLAAAVNAMNLALLDAGAMMKCTVGAVTVAITSNDVMSNSAIVVDPTAEVEESATAVATFVFVSTDRSILTTLIKGEVTVADVKRCSDAAYEALDGLFLFQRESLSKKYSRLVEFQ